MIGDMRKCREMTDKLRALDGVEVKEMFFDHP
jgi:metal-responsive CopG/Arc/MetJ family transcriptional regulator